MSQTPGDMTRIPAIPEGIAWRAYDGEVLVVSSDDAQVRTLSDVGSFAFERFDGQSDLSSVVVAITNEFDVTEETARTDLLTFAEDLHGRGLIIWTD
jgi:hypothetical protein